MATDDSGELPALFRRFPELRERVAWRRIVEAPTPVVPLSTLGRRFGLTLLVKRDDRSATPYGGNKPRKLEFLLAGALSRRSRRIITFGARGSHHALATALYGRQFGLRVTAILIPQPDDPAVRQTLALTRRHADRVALVGSSPVAAAIALRHWLLGVVEDGRPPTVILPGGSTPLGTLGYVSAACELAEQIAAGEAPVPDAIFVAAGSSGTAAGLLAGARLLGLPCRIVAVRVSDYVRVDAAAIAGLANRTITLMRRAGASITAAPLTAADVEVLEGYIGRGYGYRTDEADRAARLLAESEGIVLDHTYTAKTMAAVLDAGTTGRYGRTLLFWHTYGLPANEPSGTIRV
ncbi:MAG: pyridoxal-phosphate dependent enzyme [Chloroflexi bacterium]|nr:pyridoxal-phosphate dependent enzyme [Chloroflexota bacterium]